MAQHPHIPKFGSWDGDNVPYTAYFESARKDKGTGVRMNPNPADNIASQRSASVPVFGAWDEKEPKSGEGFTVIFQKVKEEKQIAAGKFPPVPQQPTNFSYSSEKKETRAKKCCRCCCFF